MRHILINILLILAFLGSFAQNQQVLKNGFVAATDSGLYYLQDGFNEWLNLGTINANIYDNRFIRNVDTITGVTFYEKELVCVGAGLSNGSNGEDLNMWINYYSHHITDEVYVNLAGSTETYNRKNIKNKFKSGMIVFGILESFGNNSCNITCFNTGGNRNGYYFLDNGDYDVSRTRLATDNDTIFVVASHNNILVKCKNTVISTGNSNTEFTDNINISGLHSRPTDSHQICYNPDDDEFVIISDSGIVYIYDKITLTTVDTLSFPLAAHDIKDIKYLNGYYFIIAGLSTGQSQYLYKYDITTKTLTYIFNITNNLGNLAVNPIENYILFNYGGLFILYDINGNLVKSPPNLIPRQVFDLDYINYLPN